MRGRLNRRIATDPTRSSLASLGALMLAYLLTTWRVAGRGLGDPLLLYWRDWSDQGLYARSTDAFAALNLDPAQHWYPFLYPLLAAPFTRLSPGEPFFPVDLACYLLAFAGFRRVASAFGIGGWFAAVIFAAATLGQFVFAKLWIEPWTTTLSAALLWLALGLVTRPPATETPPRARRREACSLGLVIALVPFARPGDAPVAAIIGSFGLFTMVRARDVAAAGWAIASGAAALALFGALYLAIYGPHVSQYLTNSADYGFNFAWLGWKAYVLLVDPRAWFGEGAGLIERAPWLALGAAGLLQRCISGDKAARPLALCLALVAAVHAALTLAYIDLVPPGLWRFNNAHYFKWLLPLFALFAVTLARDAARRPSALLLLAPVALALCLEVVPIEVGSAAPARMLVFDTPPGSDWDQLYFARGIVTDRSGAQRNVADYHQVRATATVRAIALRRTFRGGERWYGDSRAWGETGRVATETAAPPFLAGPWPRSPSRRFDARPAFGLPCWISRRCPPDLDSRP